MTKENITTLIVSILCAPFILVIQLAAVPLWLFFCFGRLILGKSMISYYQAVKDLGEIITWW